MSKGYCTYTWNIIWPLLHALSTHASFPKQLKKVLKTIERHRVEIPWQWITLIRGCDNSDNQNKNIKH